MYKTLYSVMVHPIQGDPITFSDNDTTPGASSAVLAQLAANKDVDSVFDDDGNITHVIFPLHAVDYADVIEQRTEGEYEDDNAKNCTESGEVETGTLTIRNDRIAPADNIHVLFAYDTPGTYGGIEFEADTSDQGTFIGGTIPSLAAGASIVIDGIPVNTEYGVYATNFEKRGIVPDSVVIDQK